MKKAYYTLGSLFFFLASCLVIVLVYKAWVWWNWIHRMDNTFGLLDL